MHAHVSVGLENSQRQYRKAVSMDSTALFIDFLSLSSVANESEKKDP